MGGGPGFYGGGGPRPPMAVRRPPEDPMRCALILSPLAPMDCTNAVVRHYVCDASASDLRCWRSEGTLETHK